MDFQTLRLECLKLAECNRELAEIYVEFVMGNYVLDGHRQVFDPETRMMARFSQSPKDTEAIREMEEKLKAAIGPRPDRCS